VEIPGRGWGEADAWSIHSGDIDQRVQSLRSRANARL
jgi:hypothetical protein